MKENIQNNIKIKDDVKKELKSILIINICKNSLHYFEFVKPIESIIENLGYTFETIPYNKLLQNKSYENLKRHLNTFDHIIISGTSLRDNDYLAHVEDFEFIKELDVPILGICGGMQIIAKNFGAKVSEGLEIGMIFADFDNFLGLDSKHEVYAIHNLQITCPQDFEVKATSNTNGYIQAIKHAKKELYGVLFHPEVRNHKIIETFLYSN